MLAATNGATYVWVRWERILICMMQLHIDMKVLDWCAGSRLLRNAARLPVTCRRECKRAAYHRGMCDCLIHPDEDMLIEHQGAAAKHHAGNHDCLQHSDLDLANECGCCPHGVQASIDAHVGKTA